MSTDGVFVFKIHNFSRVYGFGGMERWNGMDWTGLDWTGMDWNGME